MDDEWELLVGYLALVCEDAPQSKHSLREVFNAISYLVRTGVRWRFLPHDFPPWDAVDQQARRWLDAGVFEADLRAIFRLVADRGTEPTAVILDGRTLHPPLRAAAERAG
ncbi:transposase IS4 family protein [Planctopirus limnophila DSM 3776]|uniref:Transposase IS4 family protein n=2 Tax=Planctopirus limnophila TaxID=120 RepID=D5SST9_PLAL2|nr:transposase IS4 family protein [Planctopirus limnophila DSM 3776]